MQRGSFDFDVVTGPAPTRTAPKPGPKPAPGRRSHRAGLGSNGLIAAIRRIGY